MHRKLSGKGPFGKGKVGGAEARLLSRDEPKIAIDGDNSLGNAFEIHDLRDRDVSCEDGTTSLPLQRDGKCRRRHPGCKTDMLEYRS